MYLDLLPPPLKDNHSLVVMLFLPYLDGSVSFTWVGWYGLSCYDMEHCFIKLILSLKNTLWLI